MGIVFVTGAPGVGKTATTAELLSRGHTVYDTDDPQRLGIAGWHNLETGEYVAGFNELAVTPALLDTHIWKLTDAAIDDFRSRSHDELIFLVGRLRDAKAVIDISSYVIFLTATSDTIRQRLAKRSVEVDEVTWGREEWQIQRSIEVNHMLENEYRAIGALMVSAERPVNFIVDDILSATAR